MNEGRMNPRLIQPGSIAHTRIPVAEEVPDVEHEPVKYNMIGLMHLAEQIGALAKLIEDRRLPVDRYNPQNSLMNLPANTPLLIQNQYEFGERIETVIVNGPPGAYTLQLGDRIWTPTMPVAGIQVFSPLGILLSRQDAVQLTSAVAGDWSVELTGFADVRY